MLQTLIGWVVDLFVSTKILYILFIIAIRLKTLYEEGQLPKWLIPFGWIYAYTFLILDVAYRIIWGSIIMVTWPKWETMTALLKEYHYNMKSDYVKHIRATKKLLYWRMLVAHFFCKLLNKIDPGHC